MEIQTSNLSELEWDEKSENKTSRTNNTLWTVGGATELDWSDQPCAPRSDQTDLWVTTDSQTEDDEDDDDDVRTETTAAQHHQPSTLIKHR